MKIYVYTPIYDIDEIIGNWLARKQKEKQSEA